MTGDKPGRIKFGFKSTLFLPLPSREVDLKPLSSGGRGKEKEEVT
jgi:hypothetical protein